MTDPMPVLAARQLLGDADALADNADVLRNSVDLLKRDVRAAHDRLRTQLVAEQLAAMRADSLRSATGKAIRNIGKLPQHGYRSVLDVLGTSPASLQQIPA